MVVAQFLLTFREGLEAALLVGIIAAYLAKVGRKDLYRYVFLGSIAAVAVSVAIGLGIAAWASELADWQLEAFEGIAALSAVAVLTYMIFWMASNSRKLKGKLEEKLDLQLSKGQVLGVALLSFVAVVREGIETVLFLSTFVSEAVATAVGVVAAAAAVLVLTYLMFRGVYSLNLRRFFTYTSLLLIVFAAGLIAMGVHDLNEVYGDIHVGIPAVIDHVWNINGLLDSNGPVGSILAALVGYDGSPSLTQAIAYIAYWVVAGTYALWTFGPGRAREFMARVGRAFRRHPRAPTDG